jgi:isocitrate/isopropylmalate dehydrogenase
MMLEWLGFKQAANSIENAVRDSVAGKETTRDLGGWLSTTEAGAAIRNRIREERRVTNDK